MSLYKKNETFQFVVYRENFLSSDECDKLIKTLDKDLTEGTIVGDYTTDKVNKNIRNTLNKPFKADTLGNKINSAVVVANINFFNYDIDKIDGLRFLKYGIGGTYNWHTDYGRNQCSMRKLTAVVQLSDEKDYEGGDFEFGITDAKGNDLVVGNKSKGCLMIFPSFLSHRVAPITKGTRYSIITWMEGDTFR
tara:strand:- start:777 stop:1352 length:576 start_codon:yes stop_codon:yes gene_type:complete